MGRSKRGFLKVLGMGCETVLLEGMCSDIRFGAHRGGVGGRKWQDVDYMSNSLVLAAVFSCL